MYFQKTGTRFKQLMSQRSASFGDDKKPVLDDRRPVEVKPVDKKVDEKSVDKKIDEKPVEKLDEKVDEKLEEKKLDEKSVDKKPDEKKLDDKPVDHAPASTPSTSRHRRDSSWVSQAPSVFSLHAPASDESGEPAGDFAVVIDDESESVAPDAASSATAAATSAASTTAKSLLAADAATATAQTGLRTSRSSQSSVCSCDCGSAHVSDRPVSPLLCEIHNAEERSPSSLSAHVIPPLSPLKLFGDAETWNLIFQSNEDRPATAASDRPSLSHEEHLEPPRDSHSRASSFDKSETDAVMAPSSAVVTPMEEKDSLDFDHREPDDESDHADPAEWESDPDAFADNVDQLIRETDAAFQAVGSAIADAKAVTHDWRSSNDNVADTHGPPPPIPQRAARKQSHLQPQETLPPVPMRSPMRLQTPPAAITIPPPLKSPASITSAKSTKSSKTPITGKRKADKKRFVSLEKSSKKASPTSPKPSTKESTHARWTLMEMTANMAEVFSGKIFKQDVDEMLTPARLEQIRKANCKIEYRNSSESNQSDEDSIPTKESVELTPKASMTLLPSPDLPPPSAPPAVPPKSREQLKKAKPMDLSLESKKLSIVREDEEGEEPEEGPPKTPDGLAISGMSFPSPPALSPSKSSPARSIPDRAGFLPAIAEGSPFLLSEKSFGTWTKVPDSPLSEYINLPSTSFSLIAPTYMHGPIRIERSQLSQQRRDSEVEEDDALDWTAFQVAIAGTLDDTDIWETHEDEMDDLLDWWADFGFDGYGGMVTAPRTKKKSKSESSINATEIKESRPKGRSREHSKVTSRRNSRSAKEKKERRRTRDSKSTTKAVAMADKPAAQKEAAAVAAEPKSRKSPPPQVHGRWEFEYHKDKDVLVWQEQQLAQAKTARTKSVVSSVPSLPPSPMLDFKLLQLGTDGGLDSVPMGFNLGHDLGDFLNWETYHVNNLGEAGNV